MSKFCPGSASCLQVAISSPIDRFSNTAYPSSVWMNRPLRSFGSNQVLFGGMI